VYSAREHKRIYRTFPTEAAARTWRQDALIAVRRGAMKAARVPTVREAWTEWIAGAEAGVVLTRSKERYKPSTVRGYRQAMRDVILPDLGPMRLDELRRSDLQRLVERQRKKGKGASTVRNTLLPVRAIYRRAMQLGQVPDDPTVGIVLPSAFGGIATATVLSVARAAHATAQPAAAIATAVAAPTPRLAPVTIATLPSSSIGRD